MPLGLTKDLQQMFSTIDHSVEELPIQFCEEAESIINAQNDRQVTDSVIDLAALQFLSLGYLGQGRDHAVLKYLAEAINVGERMGLWGVDDDRAKARMDKMSDDEANNFLFITWGVFNWIT